MPESGKITYKMAFSRKDSRKRIDNFDRTLFVILPL